MLNKFHEHRRNPFCRRIGSLARTVHYAYEHPGYDLAANREEGVLRTLRGAEIDLALDVGANHGEWTRLLLWHHPAARAHLFEVAPQTYAHLARELASMPGATLHVHGLRAIEETVEFRYDPSQDGLTTSNLTMHDRAHDIFSGRIQAGEAWAKAWSIAYADFLKIDVEGMEIEVLRGFGRLVSGGSFRFIQFEHYFGRAILHDFYALLRPAGYVYWENLLRPRGPRSLRDGDGKRHRTQLSSGPRGPDRLDQSPHLRLEAVDPGPWPCLSPHQ